MLLKLACLHSSASSAGNNMLAWVGDAAMQLVISEQLCARYPTTSVGDLTRVRSYLVSRPTFAQYAAHALHPLSVSHFMIPVQNILPLDAGPWKGGWMPCEIARQFICSAGL